LLWSELESFMREAAACCRKRPASDAWEKYAKRPSEVNSPARLAAREK
jgi:hypothetical protein